MKKDYANRTWLQDIAREEIVGTVDVDGVGKLILAGFIVFWIILLVLYTG